MALIIFLFATVLLIASASALQGTFTIPYKFPLFKQCDEPWANDIMDTKTICAVGCLMSSTAMVSYNCS